MERSELEGIISLANCSSSTDKAISLFTGFCQAIFDEYEDVQNEKLLLLSRIADNTRIVEGLKCKIESLEVENNDYRHEVDELRSRLEEPEARDSSRYDSTDREIAKAKAMLLLHSFMQMNSDSRVFRMVKDIENKTLYGEYDTPKCK